jgi:putative drug exporter of the RND superfamily
MAAQHRSGRVLSAVRAAETVGLLSKRGRYGVVLAWLVVLLAALPLASQVNERLDATARLDGSESAGVTNTLRDEFRSPFATVVLLRVAGGPSPLTSDGRAMLERVTRAIGAVRGVGGVLSYLQGDRALVGRDGSSIVIVGLDLARAPADSIIAQLQAVGDGLRIQLRESYPPIAFRWTGEEIINADIRLEGSNETNRAELWVFPITLTLLLLAFRSVVAAALPLLCGALTLLVTLGLAVAVNEFWPMSVILVSVVSMVGLGLSIDYALLIISRYREALAQGKARALAVLEARQHAGRTVIVSGSAVAISFAAMLMVRVNEVRSIGVGGLLVSAVSVLVAVTLLPAVLVWIGPWIDAGRIGGVGSENGRIYWRRWAHWVDRHPLWVLIFAGLPVLLLAAQATRLRTDLPRDSWLPANVESVRVLNEFESIGRSNMGQTIRVIVDLPRGVTIDSDSGWSAVSNIASALVSDERIDRVWAVTENIARNALPTLAPEARRALISADGRQALVELLPQEGLAAEETNALLRQIRSADGASLSKLPGTRLRVGGVAAFNADYEAAMSSSLQRVVVSVVCATLLVLSVVFRSVLISLKAVALNLLSVTAAFGAVVLVFQEGHGAQLFGLAHGLNGGFPIVPVLVFCAVFGLSMDYEVFLVSRIAAGHRAGLADGQALAEALASTGRVITLAAAVMVAVFGGFVLGGFVLVKILGFALGVAVLIDATLVRLALGPALISLAGRLNWWPGDAGNAQYATQKQKGRS